MPALPGECNASQGAQDQTERSRQFRGGAMLVTWVLFGVQIECRSTR